MNPFILLYIAAIVIGIATFVEDAWGTSHAHHVIYGAIWFKILWTCLIIVSSAFIIRKKLWKRMPVFMLHLSFGLIFAGAMTTALTGQKGMMHLRKGIPSEEYITPDSRIHTLPFSLRLDSFEVRHYPGTTAPSDYVSHITGMRDTEARTLRISMNQIYSDQGFRFYQSSYDEDGEGSWLTVNYDPWGTALAYAGFLLFGISAVVVLCSRHGEFRRLLQHPLIRKSGILVLFCLIGEGLPAHASLPVIKRTQADSLAYRPIMYNDRIAPFNTMAKDFVQKIYGRPGFRGLTPEQVISSWMLYPEEWSRTPIILIKSRELRTWLGVKEQHVSLSDLFNGTQYRLQPLWQQEKDRQSKLAKAIRETDEKVGLILMLGQGTLFRPVPPGIPRPDESKIRAEVFYNRIPSSKILFMANLTLGFLSIGLLLFRLLKGRRAKAWESRTWSMLLCAATLFHASGYLLRWYISGNIPLSNGYETMQFVALAILLITCLLHRRFTYTLPFGFLLSGFTLLVAYLGEMNPQITPLMPVLASPWLSYHVSLIMVSYSLFAFMFLNGILALILVKKDGRPEKEQTVMQLTLLSRILLYPAEMMLGIGIMLGAVWANVSWGSYWSWDPKEVWALVAFIVYGCAFHPRSMKWLRRPKYLHVYMIAAFFVILMTYFGVNYLLGGMHSYANA